jgi:hypothetical protein
LEFCLLACEEFFLLTGDLGEGYLVGGLKLMEQPKNSSLLFGWHLDTESVTSSHVW